MYKILASFICLLFFISCEKDFEEINQNPFFPTETDIGPLFNNVVSSLRLGWNEQFYLHNEKLYQVTQLAALTAETFQNISIGTEDVWQNYYLALAHVRAIERKIVELENTDGFNVETLNNLKAQLKIITAYKTFKLTDLFGDIPFFDAGKGFEDLAYLRPKFDTQESIYLFLLDELKWAAENINLAAETEDGQAYFSLDNFDTFFENDLFKWTKFANSLRLKHALRMYDASPEIAAETIADVLGNSLPLILAGEDVLMHPQKQSWIRGGSHWSFREHNKLRMGSTIWEAMAEGEAAEDIFDPRAYFYFETNNANEWNPFPQLAEVDTEQSGGAPYAAVRDVNFSIKGAANIYSPVNYYLIRDENTVPEIIMTAAEMNFIIAEIYLRGIGVAENIALAEGEYTIGLVNSILFWQGIKQNSEIWEVGPADLSQSEVFSVSQHPRLDIFNSAEKLKLVINQRWVDSFRQPWEAFALLRRTNTVPRIGAENTFNRFTYPPSEIENNPENYNEQQSLMGGDLSEKKIWWMN